MWDAEIAALAPDPDLEQLARKARTATQKAHANRSKFCVGAALRTTDGKVITAANVENASYGLTSCAERNAVFRAVAERGNTVRFNSIALVAVADDIDVAKRPTISPCGACRQVLFEFRADDSARVLYVSNGVFVTKTVLELLPEPFTLGLVHAP